MGDMGAGSARVATAGRRERLKPTNAIWDRAMTNDFISYKKCFLIISSETK